MWKQIFIIILVLLPGFLILQLANGDTVAEKITTPPYLYKIISVENWKASTGMKEVTLSSEDEAFIHLAEEDQLERIIDKYWNHVSEFVVLKVDTSKLPGKLVLEPNPGGTTQYYHLYHGSIPLNAIIESKIRRSSMR
jgi:uncharacterized protein (DUF952 family)